jgi:hypothetical protein
MRVSVSVHGRVKSVEAGEDCSTLLFSGCPALPCETDRDRQGLVTASTATAKASLRSMPCHAMPMDAVAPNI